VSLEHCVLLFVSSKLEKTPFERTLKINKHTHKYIKTTPETHPNTVVPSPQPTFVVSRHGTGIGAAEKHLLSGHIPALSAGPRKAELPGILKY